MQDGEIAVIFNSRNNQTRKDSNGNFISVATLLRRAWQNAIK